MPHYAEVFIRTLKQIIHDRLEGQGLNLDRWIDVYKKVLSKYNLSIHSSIIMNPYHGSQKIKWRFILIIGQKLKMIGYINHYM